MNPRSGSSRIASGFSGRAAGTPDPRDIDGDPTEAHVVQGSTRRELGAAAAGGKIANQPVRGSVVVCLAGLNAQRCGGVAGRCVPANEEFAGAGVKKNEACRVQWQRTLLKEARREGEAEVIGSEDFRPGIADTGRRPGHAVQDASFPGTDIPAGTSRSSCPGGCGSGLAKSKRCAFGLVQLQCTGKSIENRIGHTA